MQRAAADGCEKLIGVSLFPQWCSATSQSVFEDLRKAASALDRPLPILEIDRYPEDPRYLDALTGTVRVALARFLPEERAGVHILFSAHGVPVSIIKKGDPYEREIRATVSGVVARLPEGTAWSLSFQSKVGPVKWLEPSTIDHLADLGRRGVKKIVVVPVAFVSDHIETLHEQKILLAGIATAAGVEKYEVCRALNECPLFAEALAGLVKKAEAAR